MPPAMDQGGGFANTVREFTADAYVGIHSDWWLAGSGARSPVPITTSLDREQIVRIENGADGIASGKRPLRAPEPPTVAMFCTGAGMLLIFGRRRTVHRPGRRKVKAEKRLMASLN